MHESALAEIRTAIARLLPTGVASSSGAIAGPAPPLLASELPATARMSARRLAEFAAGRSHARRALKHLGLRSAAVPVGPDRAPQWPGGFVGSISHSAELVLAVAARTTTVGAIGIDLEPATPLDDDLMSRVCRPEELEQLARSTRASHLAKLVFSAKESVYKCLAPRTGVFLEFEDLEIQFDTGSLRFRTRGHGPAVGLVGPGWISGAFVEAGGYWITAAWQAPQADSGQA